ncbi:MAG: putative redox protein YhfA [Rhodobacteraceae bacterium HLUCCA12]|nr:MAG: putative redox protein YhfA [Rhodobacteraceae bacterium HLUCCA12]
MKHRKIEFEGHSGATLAARLDLPEGPVRAAALFAHCFTCTKDLAAARRIAGRLAARGIAVLRFDFTGLGHSDGEFANTGFVSNVEDIRAAAEWMQSQDMAPQLLIGHSLGGAAVLAAASEIKGVRAVVTIGAPADPAHVLRHFSDALGSIRDKGKATVELAGRAFEIGRQLVDEVEQSRLTRHIGAMRAALLILHSPRDETVGIDNAATIFKAARHPKSFVTLDDADHLLTRAADAEYAAELIAAWAARYLVMADEPARADAPEGVVRVAEAEASGFRQDVVIDGKHQLVADEPEAMGGTDLGPSPYQLLAAGLGACTTMTLRMYARHKKIPLEHVACDVSHERRHRDDSEKADEGGKKVDVFNRVIRLEGDLTKDQRDSLLAIADKCPVHRTLHSSAEIRTRLA